MRTRSLLTPVPLSGAAALVLSLVWAFAPTMGTDTSAQEAHASFFAAHGFALIDFAWYGGAQPLGYSLVSPPVMALLGVTATGVIAATASAGLLAALFARCGVARPLLGGLLGAVTMAGNLVSGRVTFALGVAFALAALFALTHRRGLPWAAAAAVLAGATSPVAALVVGVAAVALLAVRWRAVLVVGVAAAVPMGVMTVLFGDGGWMNFSPDDFWRALSVTLLVAVAGWFAKRREVLAGAVAVAVGLTLSYLLKTPVGANAMRLTVLFALPVLAAITPLPRRGKALVLTVALVAVAWWLPPVNIGDVKDAGNTSASRGYYAPLLAELARRGPVGRIEIPPTRDYWEAAYVDVPLARGWLRQLDIARNPLFFATTPGRGGTGVALTPDSYRAWLLDAGVSYVAVPDTSFSWVGRPEAALIAGGLPYLTPVWSDAHWTLYAVADPAPLVAAPATLVSSTAAGVVFDAPAAGDYLVRVRPLRWLSVDGPGAPRWRTQGAWTVVTVSGPGRYTVA
ncbi:MFS transporter [Actinorhabdospora filicis]|uniref:MFS transporter n=1 Tax=Actinorhabdospora filicis TaxID=1785913 RepID=A0A9W6SG72_9ACTN|nr:hypothetical protein [Actinorhabdospora filicis]GLZ75723.1 MFS transporter [Actinorhabdospora filicis]